MSSESRGGTAQPIYHYKELQLQGKGIGVGKGEELDCFLNLLQSPSLSHNSHSMVFVSFSLKQLLVVSFGSNKEFEVHYSYSLVSLAPSTYSRH